ncbi:unnamed protein product [Calypogeia fissa]
MEFPINRGKRCNRLLLLLLVCIACASTIVCQQTGYVSIDCGSPVNYTDETGIFWDTDDKYIYTGRNLETLVKEKASYYGPFANKEQAGTIRIFDDPRSRDCYVLPVQFEQTYLLRPTFYFGNVGPLTASTSGSFDIWVDNNYWVSISWNNDTDYYPSFYFELIYSARLSTLTMCIIRGEVPAFISALELRQLPNSMYNTVVGPLMPSWMTMVERINCGPPEGGSLQQWRYPNDTCDRIWTLFGLDDHFPTISASNVLGSSPAYTFDPDRPPSVVTEDAWVSPGSNLTIEIDTDRFNGQLGTQQFYVAAYFQELNASAGNSRGMDFYLNDLYIGSFNSVNYTPLEISTVGDVLKSSVNISFLQSRQSSLGPSLNAYEVYQFYGSWSTNKTSPDDVIALYALQRRLNLLDWTGDPCLPTPFDWLSCSNDGSPRLTNLTLASQGYTGGFPMEILNLTALTTFALNNNSFSGSIPDFSSLVHLESIYLQNNNFSGEIPTFLGNAFPNLTQLNLNSNNLNGIIPSDLSNKPGLDFTVLNNPLIINCTLPTCGYALPVPPPVVSTLGTGRSTGHQYVLGGIVGGVAVLGIALVAGIAWMLSTTKKRARLRVVKAIEQAENHTATPNNYVHVCLKPLGSSLTFLTLQEVSDATAKFSKKIGEGAFGPVYYGKLPNEQEVAVKVKKSNSRQGIKEFLNEVDLLSRIHHRNLVSLIGYCKEDNQHILIYVYFSNGTLRDHLYGDKSSKRLDWSTRLDIALNSAKGLDYLHTDCQPRIIHRDVKSSNILLDENMVAKVADFGISKQAPEGASSGVETVLKGTMGYFDPEYFTSQKLTPKSDVYSFGVVLLEIISGRHPLLSDYPDGTTDTLIEWVKIAVNNGRAMEIVDLSLTGRFKEESMMKVISLAISCIDPVRATRPDMAQVVHVLAEAIKVELSSSGNHDSVGNHATVVESTSQEQDGCNKNFQSISERFGGAMVDQSVLLPR